MIHQTIKLKIMKKYIYIAFVGLFLSSACSDFLDVEPVSQGSTNNFYKTPEDILIAVNSVYGSLQPMYGQHMYRLGELRSDNTFLDGDPGGNRQSTADIDFFQVQTNNGILLDFWNTSYKGIANANTVLDRIDNVTFEDAQLKNRIIGEAKFLRALFYFNLVRVFGKVPLVISEVKNPSESSSHIREEIATVYTQIETDLTVASTLLDDSYSGANVGRATSWAALSLLGKVQITQEKYPEAAATLKNVVDNGPYVLETNYSSIFDPTNKNGKESIFEVQFNGGIVGEGSPFVNDFAPRFSTTVASSGDGVGNNQPTNDIVQAYNSVDLRFDPSLDTLYINSKGAIIKANYITKYLNGTTLPGQGNDNFPVLRYADVLLLLAEAEFFNNGGGLTQLNLVRSRAGLPDAITIDLDVILEERRIELAFEDHRWFDLIRTDKALEVMNAYLADAKVGAKSIQRYQYIYPIPQSQIDVNPDALSQNEGYQ